MVGSEEALGACRSERSYYLNRTFYPTSSTRRVQDCARFGSFYAAGSCHPAP